MKNRLCIIICLILASGGLMAQNQTGLKIAVANPNVLGLHASPEIAAKLIRLELVKLNIYSVYDEFDMADVVKNNPAYQAECYGINCLTEMGRDLKVDYIVSGSFDGLGNKIAITLKIIDVKNQTIYKSSISEFDNQEIELQRMIEIMLKSMHGIAYEETVYEQLRFKNEPITSTNIGRINNNGPRIGYAVLVGSMNEFATRPSIQGGLDIFPAVTMIGYQLEGQYVGTENFSALIEGIINFTGMEQGVFIPSLTVLNGFRFGKAGWEFAFGPGFSLRRTSDGFFDGLNLFGKGEDYYWTEDEYFSYMSQFIPEGEYIPTAYEYSDYNSNYSIEEYYDKRADARFSTTWVIGAGRTFRAGALNVPVNAFYSSNVDGGMLGLSVGFNVQKSKVAINE